MINVTTYLRALIITGIMLSCVQARAGTYIEDVYWGGGTASGQLAATCSYTYPDERPLSISRTLMVDKNASDGTILFSWGYGEFWSDITINCISSGISNSIATLAGAYPSFRFLSQMLWPDYYQTSDTGIQLKIWLRYNADCSYLDGVLYLSAINVYGSSCYAAGTEMLSLTGSSNYVGYRIYPYSSGGQVYFPTATASLSFRAELIKKGTVSYSSPLTVSTSPYITLGATTTVSGILSGSGIQIIPPACQLKTTDYSIPMGRWAADSIKYIGTPAQGPQVPVNLSLECSGSVDHVRFRFEDTGSSLSGNQNVSLYDTAGGNKIDGLEIEMLYNGTKVNVDNSTLTDTGSHGAFVSLTPDFDSFSTAPFHARYVQNSDITLAGSIYSGPIAGKVNMYVTYD